MNTLYLVPKTWDLTLNVDGNIALASDPYSVAQDCASAIKTFLGECFYDTTLGVPYFGQILGKSPPLSLIKAKLVAAAETVPGATNVVVYISSIKDRVISGQVQMSDANGNVTAAGF